jgi:sigma-B regulation protein RsbU (phosphoserine phosphatase)
VIWRVAFAILVVGLAACAGRRELPQLDGWKTTRRGSDVVASATLPAGHRYTYLVFRAYHGELEARVDGKSVYAFYDPFASQRVKVHVIPIANARRVELRFYHAPRSMLFDDDAYLAAPVTLAYAIDRAALDPLRDDFSDIVLGIILLVVGAVAWIASSVQRRGDAPALRYFGIFTVLYGTRLLVDTDLPTLLGIPLRMADYAESFITYVIPIAGWGLPRRLIGDGWKNSLRWQVFAFTVFAPIGIVADLVTRTPGSLELVNNVLVIIGGVNILLNLLIAPQRRELELRVVLVASIVFMLFAVNNNLVALGVLPWAFNDETLGFVIFVAALGFAATRRFLRGERERLAIDNELRTARDIQRSILPSAMPLVPGLAFQAGYEPATSVAGDLYDFRADDAGVAVVVADVAGHGVPAALIASMVKIAIASQTTRDPAVLLTALNDTLRREVRRAFVTATALWFDATRHRVVVCNAGHPPPLLLREGAFSELGVSGVLLGRFANVRYTATEIALQPGDRIVAYTDGVPEARNARGEAFGEERLRDAVRKGEDVLAAVHAWRDDEDADDLTIVIVDVMSSERLRLEEEHVHSAGREPG